MSSIEKAMRRKQSTRAQEAPRPVPTNGRAVRKVPRQSTHPLDQLQRVPDVSLDHDRLGAQGLLTPQHENNDLREQYRLVKRKLITQAFVNQSEGPTPPNLIEVTSSMVGEGKTFTTFNLGMSVAMERDVTVLLVDADLTRRSLTNLVGLVDRPGLTDLLTGAIDDIGDVVYRTDMPRLSIIPAGEGHSHATELIASDTMRDYTRELASRYNDRLIIFDSTPLLMDTQASTLAHHMGQILLVVEAGRTGERMLHESVSLLETSRSSTSLLLNKSSRSPGYGYYGGY